MDDFADIGVRPGGDVRMRMLGVLAAIDTTKHLVQVSVDGGTAQWMPALPGQYLISQTVWVLKNPFSSSYVLCLGPALGATPQVLGTVTAINTTTVRMTVTMPDGSSQTLPYIAATYSVGQQVWVQLDPTQFGAAGFLVIGPAALPPPAPAPPPPVTVPSAPTTVTRTATVYPAWSGTWRGDQGRWNQWNVNTNGIDALWQGSGYGASGLVGLATYGNRFTDLGALSFLSAVVLLRGANASAASYPGVVVQGAPHSSQPAGAPTPSGDTTTGFPGRTGTAQPALTSNMCEALRTGSARSLATVGAYAAVKGTGAPDGMAVTVTYTTAG